MNLKEIKSEFESELENGLDHAEWYEKEIKWLIEQAEKIESINELIKGKWSTEKIYVSQLWKVLNK